LSAAVENAVRSGALVPGDRLAPVRQVAVEAGVSPATAAAAYRELTRRGVVRTAGRAGTVVAPGPPLPSRPRLVVPAGVRNLADGNPDPALLPDLAPALAAVRPPFRLYGDEPAHPELFRLAREGFEADGIAVPALAVVGGALDGVERSLTAHLRPGDAVVVEDPGYAGLYDLISAAGFVPRPVPVDGLGLEPEALRGALESGARAVIAVPRAQNPTGAAFDPGRAATLNARFREHPSVLVIEDDHAGPVAGAPALTATTGLDRWAVVRSYAKSLAPDLRVAVLAGDPVTVARVQGRQSVGTGWVSHILQAAAAHLLARRSTQARFRTAARRYGERSRALIEALAAHGISARGGTGLNIWVPVPEEQGVVRALLDAGWAVAAGEPYRRQAPPAVRITTAALDPAEAPALAAALAAALRPSHHRTG
jgi:DNA-binding transcriptional MocR family regulator